MFKLGKGKKKQESRESLDTVTASIPATSIHKVRKAVYLNENNYIALKNLCDLRGWKITVGVNGLLHEKLVEEYKKEAANMRLNTRPRD